MLPRRPMFALLSVVMLPPLALFAQLQPARPGLVASRHNPTRRSALSDSIIHNARMETMPAPASEPEEGSFDVSESAPRVLNMGDAAASGTPDSLTYQRKSALTAFALSTLIAGGGQLYAGETKKGVILMALEVGGVGMTVLSGTADGDASFGLAAYGVVLALGSWIYSAIDAPHAARRYNEKHARAQPIVDADRGRALLLGMRVELGR